MAHHLCVRYDFLLNREIVAINGPLHADDWPDIAIFCNQTMGTLNEGERVSR